MQYLHKKHVVVLIMILAIFLTVCAPAQPVFADTQATNQILADGDGVVIYLDPGHDSRHSGCTGFGLSEEQLNLKVAMYCKTELEKYEGVTVYLSRTSSKCPAGKCSVITDNAWRVTDAVNKHADIYVALHFNSEYRVARGCTVIVPNKNGNREVYNKGQIIGQAVQDELVGLGIKDKGLMIRNSENRAKYADGKRADYYAVIKNTKQNDMVGIIVEHAFLTNRSDVRRFCNSETKLKRLGKADARGIAKYFGLKKKKSDRVSFVGIVQNSLEQTTVTWNAYAGADSYRVYRRESAEDSWECIAEVEDTTYEDMNIYSDTTYYYSVKAHLQDKGTYTTRSRVFSITTAYDVNNEKLEEEDIEDSEDIEDMEDSEDEEDSETIVDIETEENTQNVEET